MGPSVMVRMAILVMRERTPLLRGYMYMYNTVESFLHQPSEAVIS
jgi:hypothetical protein